MRNKNLSYLLLWIRLCKLWISVATAAEGRKHKLRRLILMVSSSPCAITLTKYYSKPSWIGRYPIIHQIGVTVYLQWPAFFSLAIGSQHRVQKVCQCKQWLLRIMTWDLLTNCRCSTQWLMSDRMIGWGMSVAVAVGTTSRAKVPTLGLLALLLLDLTTSVSSRSRCARLYHSSNPKCQVSTAQMTIFSHTAQGSWPLSRSRWIRASGV